MVSTSNTAQVQSPEAVTKCASLWVQQQANAALLCASQFVDSTRDASATPRTQAGSGARLIAVAWSRLTLSATLRVGKPQNRDAALFINNSKARVSVSPLTKLHAKWGRRCKATCLCMQRVLARQRVTGQSMCRLPTGYGLQLQSCCSSAHGHVCVSQQQEGSQASGKGAGW